MHFWVSGGSIIRFVTLLFGEGQPLQSIEVGFSSSRKDKYDFLPRVWSTMETMDPLSIFNVTSMRSKHLEVIVEVIETDD